MLAASRYVAMGGPASLGIDAPSGRPPQLGRSSAVEVAQRVRAGGGVLVATGGCFDLLHAGHIATLRAARSLGDALVVCLNSDASVRRLKGPERPLVSAADRSRVLEAVEGVDAVVVFDEDTPDAALRLLRPDVWAKGGDYAGSELPEAAVLQEWGGQAVVLPYLPGRSTTELVDAVRTSHQQSTTFGGMSMTLGTVLVTGGACGLGAAVVEAVAAARRPAGASWTASRPDATTTSVSTCRTAGPRRMRSGTRREQVGGIDAVVTCAGIDACGRLADIPGDDWDRVIQVNLLGTAAVVRAALPDLHGAAREGGHRRVHPRPARPQRRERLLRVEVRRGRVHPSARGRAAGAGRGDAAGTRRHAYRVLRRARRAVQAQARTPASTSRPTSPPASSFALTQPPGCEVRELVVAPSVEGSWP